MKRIKGKKLFALVGCLACGLMVGAGFATWTFANQASNSNNNDVAVDAAINVTDCKVYGKEDTTNKANATATLHLTNPSSVAWEYPAGITAWTVEVDGDLSGATSVAVSVSVEVPDGFGAYCTLADAKDPTMAINEAKTAATGNFSLPAPSYVATFIDASHEVLSSTSGSTVFTPYQRYSAMKSAYAGKTIKFTFKATAS